MAGRRIAKMGSGAENASIKAPMRAASRVFLPLYFSGADIYEDGHRYQDSNSLPPQDALTSPIVFISAILRHYCRMPRGSCTAALITLA